MDLENIQLMQDQYHILRINRSIERLEKLGTSHRYPKGYIFDYREHHPDSVYYIKKGRIMAYEDALPRTMYLKKLTEIDSRIDELKKTLISLNEEKQEILDME